MNSISIRARLIGLVALLILPVLAAGGIYIRKENTNARDAETVGRIVRFSTAVGNLVHELQKERGSTAVFVGSRGQNFGQELREQRKLSDAAVLRLSAATDELGASVPAVMKAGIERAKGLVDAVPAHRAKIDALAVDLAAAGGPYTAAIAALLGNVETAAGTTGDPAVLQLLFGYANFLQGKEHAGQERAAGGGAFAGGRFDGPAIRRFGQLAGAQDAFFKGFAAAAPAALVERFRALEAATLPEVARVRQIALTSVASGNVEGMTGPVWFAISTKRIDAMKTLEDEYASLIIKRADDTAEAARSQAVRAAVLLPAGVLLALLASLLLVRSIGGSLERLRSSIVRIAETGDLADRAPVNGRDEIARTAEAFNELVGVIGGTMAAINKTMEKVADRDLTARVEAEARGDTERLKANINRTLDTVAESFGTIARSVRRIADASSATTSAVEDVSRGVNGQRHALEQVAEAIRQTTHAVTDVTDNAQRANDTARRAAHLVVEGGRKIEATVSAVSDLSNTSAEIGEITGAISRIAGRTGLLSLNASIEAANSGSANRGFAVVAGEVGKLAENSERQARQIEDLVARAAAQIARTVELTRDAKSGIDEITDGVTATSAMTASIAVAMNQQQAAVTEISASAEELDRIARRNAVSSEEIARSMDELASLTRATDAELARYSY